MVAVEGGEDGLEAEDRLCPGVEQGDGGVDHLLLQSQGDPVSPERGWVESAYFGYWITVARDRVAREGGGLAVMCETEMGCQVVDQSSPERGLESLPSFSIIIYNICKKK